MSSLLDRVLDSKDNPSVETALAPTDDRPHTLPDGSVVYDSTIAAINRIFELNPHLYKRPTMGRIYELYNGSQKINLDNWNHILSLLRGDWRPASDWQTTVLREKVMEMAPVISVGSFLVSEGLVWDKADCKLKRLEEGDTIRTTS